MDSLKALRPLTYVSLIYGGFLVITYLAFCYSALWQHEFLPIFPEAPREASRIEPTINAAVNATPNAAFNAPLNVSGAAGFQARPRFRISEDPLAVAFSPQAIAVLLTGILFIVNGYFLLRHLRHKERKETRRFVTSSLLTDEEKAVYDELIKCGGQATQKQLALNTGFSAVKTYRVLKRLEGKKVVKSFPYGMTKKIILNEAE
jgi:uncharacterized membrane protein